MKRSPLILMGILIFTVIIAYTSAGETSAPTKVQFTEFLQGFVAQGTTSSHGEWTEINGEVITGSGVGDLVGSPITFTIESDRRFNPYEVKSLIKGVWTFWSSGGDPISGNFRGNGTEIIEFTGKFSTNMSQKSDDGVYSKTKISGQFRCWFIQPPTYGGSWRYEAWWNGTLRAGED